MNDADHIALVESVLESDTHLQAHERQALEQELANYYQCLAEQGEMDLDSAMAEYAEQQAPLSEAPTYPEGYVEHCLDLKYSY
jgi:hypothetical protein